MAIKSQEDALKEIAGPVDKAEATQGSEKMNEVLQRIAQIPGAKPRKTEPLVKTTVGELAALVVANPENQHARAFARTILSLRSTHHADTVELMIRKSQMEALRGGAARGKGQRGTGGVGRGGNGMPAVHSAKRTR